MFGALTPRTARWLAGFRAPAALGWFRRPRRDAQRLPLVALPSAASSLVPGPAADAAPVLKVWLFGGLAHVAACRNFTIPLDAPASLRSLIDVMIERFGPAFRQRMMQDSGQIYSYCRLFLDGFPIEVDDIINPTGRARNLELIVLMSLEGG